jgi:arsenate reductase (glutaredoxin)
VELLEGTGVEFERVNYYVEPFDEQTLGHLLSKAGLKPREAMRTKQEPYKQMGLADSNHSDDELIALMVEHPDLIQRPLVERGDRVVLARPPETALELLD